MKKTGLIYVIAQWRNKLHFRAMYTKREIIVDTAILPRVKNEN